jgi:hypothetical protein
MLVLRYVQYSSLVLSQRAACNRLHEVEERNPGVPCTNARGQSIHGDSDCRHTSTGGPNQIQSGPCRDIGSQWIGRCRLRMLSNR